MTLEELAKEIVYSVHDPHPPGGQHVGSPRGVKGVHEPSGLTAICENHRSQHQNRKVVTDMILGGLTSPSF